MKTFLVLILICLLDFSYQQLTDPLVTSWIPTNGTGFGNYYTNVISVKYSSKYVYVRTNSIPTYSIGPWKTNPNTAKGQYFTFQYPRFPTPATTKFKVPLGHVGLWKNGVSLYNPDDGQTYNNGGIWHRNAYIWEGISFDACKGHPDGSSEYHHHISPACLYNASSSQHSPLIGYAFDGYPIYGPYAYSSAMNNASSIKRIISSYKLRSISDRSTLADGTSLSSSQAGPGISTTYPLGSFIEDFEYSAGYGDLDQYNGRTCVTPEYPNGTYAYFITLDSNLDPAYPFIIGPKFYGNVVYANLGADSGKVVISESVTTYFDSSASKLFSSSLYLLSIFYILKHFLAFFL